MRWVPLAPGLFSTIVCFNWGSKPREDARDKIDRPAGIVPVPKQRNTREQDDAVKRGGRSDESIDLRAGLHLWSWREPRFAVTGLNFRSFRENADDIFISLPERSRRNVILYFV